MTTSATNRNYSVIKTDRGFTTNIEEGISKSEAIYAVYAAANLYVENSEAAEADNLQRLDSPEEIDQLIADCKAQGADDWAERYEAVKADFTPGIWAMDFGYEVPELVYANGAEEFRHGDFAISIKAIS